jgi:hypothetical protein
MKGDVIRERFQKLNRRKSRLKRLRKKKNQRDKIEEMIISIIKEMTDILHRITGDHTKAIKKMMIVRIIEGNREDQGLGLIRENDMIAHRLRNHLHHSFLNDLINFK